MNKLIDDDYILVEDQCWVEVKGFAIKIMKTDEGVVVDVWPTGKEIDSPIASTYAFDSECLEEDDD